MMPRILVVDDSDLSRRLIGRLLIDAGWEVLTACDGAEGAVTALQEQPEVVVTDLEMPVMDGFQLARLLKSDPASADIPVLLMTSYADAASRFWGRETGANEYLLKSEVQEKLADAVRSLRESSPLDPNRSVVDAPRTPFEVLARIGRHLDARLQEAVLVNRLLQRGVEAEDLEAAAHVVLDIVSELVDSWALALLVVEPAGSVIFLRSDLPASSAESRALVESMRSALEVPPDEVVEQVVWPAGSLSAVVPSELEGQAVDSAADPDSIHLSLRGGRALLTMLPRKPLRADGRERRLLEALKSQLTLVLDNARLEQRLRELSMVDGLTRLLNRRTVHRRLVEELERSRRYDQPLSLMLCDLDHFKNINDTHGHLAGDAVLKVVADLFRAHARSVDIVGRFGGEEFVLILPNVQKAQAIQAAHRLLTAMCSDRVVTRGGVEISFTASFGVASVEELQTVTTDALFALADSRLYEAKNAGRSRVVPSDLG
ncbi:MAG: diguanylate cyclase [Thermoanaerobaculia bacterium]|nr:diguanylate cyclase [Thermoanaerobaculia bacterium]